MALLLALKSYQRMGRFPRPEEYPEAVVDFVRRAVELPEATPVVVGGRTAVRKRRDGLLAGNRIAINGVGGGRAINGVGGG
ncbi:hypothetical protein [Streptomyces sp. NBC_00454]|uniref:hypothetical protein n=1 Tax=Streptomyces sp. NBC_00454 TaxID=2975747 RepID=UPI0030E3FC24